jgi:hypothetical protein
MAPPLPLKTSTADIVAPTPIGSSASAANPRKKRSIVPGYYQMCESDASGARQFGAPENKKGLSGRTGLFEKAIDQGLP